MATIEVEGVSKTYVEKSWRLWKRDRVKKTRAIRGVSFGVKKGEIFGIVGPNGAGKTTLINMISGLVYNDSGSIKIKGKELIGNREEIAEKMNVATAYSQLQGRLTLRENLEVFGRLYNVKNLAERIKQLLSKFEIEEIEDKKVYHMSTGQQTRANLCKGLINDPEILLLDEVTAGLDPHIADIARGAIQQINQEQETTIIITSHNMRDIDELSDRMMFLQNGEILEIDTPTQIKRNIHHKVLEVSFKQRAAEVEQIVQELGGKMEEGEKDESQALFPIEEEQKVIDKLEPLQQFAIDNVALKQPDLEEVFKKIARGEVSKEGK